MSHRPLVLVSGLTFGDYLLWSWSLNSNHDVLALISGLTLPPLAVVLLWLLALSLVRLLAGTIRLPARRIRRARARRALETTRKRRPATAAAQSEEAAATAASAGTPPRKLAA